MSKPVQEINKNQSLDQLIENARGKFEAKYQSAASHCAFAPGRVNLIGEHVDYCDGLVLPMAIPLYTIVVGLEITGRDFSRIWSESFNEEARLRKPYSEIFGEEYYPDWSRYIRGILALYDKATAYDVLILSNLPLGAGLSSSASLEVAFIEFIRSCSTNSPKDSLSEKDRALLCQRAEREYAGVPCGIMDQFVVTFAREKTALLIDCRSLDFDRIPLCDNEIVILVIDSHVKHELANSEYALRRHSVEEASRILGCLSLRDVSIGRLEENQTTFDDHVIYRRARHVITEIKRTELAVDALKSSDFAKFGQLMKESHESLRCDYEVSCKEVDQLVHIANGFAGVYGSRMTGGGFGGCTVTLVKTGTVDALIRKIQDDYLGKVTFHKCSAVNGVKTVIF